MGGHGGLNILPQKRWNVYNFDNREKVRKDEEAAARDEQIKREQSRRRDAEFRLEQLRQARRQAPNPDGAESDSPPLLDSHHINLFEGLRDFSSLTGSAAAGDEEPRDARRNPRKERDEGSSRDLKKRRKEERPPAISPEDEKYRMGYGVAGKGVKAPWYLSRPSLAGTSNDNIEGCDSKRGGEGTREKKEAGGKKTTEELRAERLEREKREKERAQAVLRSSRRVR